MVVVHIQKCIVQVEKKCLQSCVWGARRTGADAPSMVLQDEQRTLHFEEVQKRWSHPLTSYHVSLTHDG